MAVLDSPEPVNLAKSIFLCNVFTFFFSAAKACLIPFLVVYFKMLGLTATQVGVIIGVKTVVAFMFAPLWAKCAVRCGRRRCVLMFSLFIMASTYLSLTAVPSMNEEFSVTCNVEKPENLTAEILNKLPVQNKTGTPATNFTTPKLILNMTQIPPVTESPSSSGKSNSVAQSTTVKTEEEENNTRVSNNVSTTKAAIIEHEKTTEANIVLPTTALSAKKVFKQILVQAGLPPSDLENLSEESLVSLIQGLLETENGQELLLKSLHDLPPDVAEDLANVLEEEDKGFGRQGRSIPDEGQAEEESNEVFTWDLVKKMLRNKWNELKSEVTETEYRMFLVILMILIIGETFCSPVDKIADDSWFEFLESIDDLEKYGMQRVWVSLAFIIFPVVVTVAVDHTSCLFGVNVHPFMLHFYLFGIFLGLSFLLAFFYPMSSSEKYKYASKVGKGMRTVCCSGRGFMFVITLLIMGSIYASYNNFLFWMLLDMGSQEITLGLCLALAALSEIPMLLFSDKLVKKIGNGGVVALALLCLSGRMLYYSFLWTPWAVLPVEITNAFTHTAMWWAVLSCRGFNSTPSLSRSIRSILSSVYFGIGFAIGSFASGIVYDTYGATILFQACAVLAIGWFPVLCISFRCCRESDKTEVKYTRLLTSDDQSDDSSTMEDDWLEQALKH